MTTKTDDTDGPLVRLWGIDSPQLPEQSATAQELTPLLTSVFTEAIRFIKDVPSPRSTTSPSGLSSWNSKGTKTFPHSTAPVKLYEKIVAAHALNAVAKQQKLPPASTGSLQPETWVLRQSIHEDAAKTGTASWDEWVKSFKEDHAEAEKAFTPTVLSTQLKHQWDCSGVEVEIGEDTWVDWSLKLEESTHKMPAPLNNRIFPVLQATASARGRREFLVVQIAARDTASKFGAEIDNGLVRGAYTSIERLKDTGDGAVEWIMGTVSDAKGVLPAWVQKMAVPGAVAKDVDMYLDWISKERKKTAASTEAK